MKRESKKSASKKPRKSGRRSSTTGKEDSAKSPARTTNAIPESDVGREEGGPSSPKTPPAQVQSPTVQFNADMTEGKLRMAASSPLANLLSVGERNAAVAEFTASRKKALNPSSSLRKSRNRNSTQPVNLAETFAESEAVASTPAEKESASAKAKKIRKRSARRKSLSSKRASLPSEEISSPPPTSIDTPKPDMENTVDEGKAQIVKQILQSDDSDDNDGDMKAKNQEDKAAKKSWHRTRGTSSRALIRSESRKSKGSSPLEDAPANTEVIKDESPQDEDEEFDPQNFLPSLDVSGMTTARRRIEAIRLKKLAQKAQKIAKEGDPDKAKRLMQRASKRHQTNDKSDAVVEPPQPEKVKEPVKEKKKAPVLSGRRLRAGTLYDEEQGTGVVYIGHIPHGFYEKEMRKYFAQFGEVARLRLSRSARTGRSRGYAFVEFRERAVAPIAAEAMDGYLMDGARLVAKYVPPDQVHECTFKPKTKGAPVVGPSFVQRKKQLRLSRMPAKIAARSRGIQKSLKNKVEHLKKRSIKYKFPSIVPRGMEDDTSANANLDLDGQTLTS